MRTERSARVAAQIESVPRLESGVPPPELDEDDEEEEATRASDPPISTGTVEATTGFESLSTIRVSVPAMLIPEGDPALVVVVAKVPGSVRVGESPSLIWMTLEAVFWMVSPEPPKVSRLTGRTNIDATSVTPEGTVIVSE